MLYGNNNRIDGASGVYPERSRRDASGNLLNDGAGGHTFTGACPERSRRNAENRLTSVTSSNGTQTYTYDTFGHRVGRTGYIDTCLTGGTTTPSPADYVFDLWDRWTAEVSKTDYGCGYEIYAGSRHVGYVRGNVGFSHTDWLGTERVRINYAYASNRNYDQHCTSLPFGVDLGPCTAQGSSTIHFTGKERDNKSGLDNFEARYFGSSLGRFMSPDPVVFSKQKMADPQQWNMHSYARNNPLRFLDPTGKYLCNGTQDECATVKAALENIRKAANNLDEGSKERGTLEKVLKVYGEEGKKNGVNVNFADLGGNAEATTKTSSSFLGFRKTTTITFDLNQIHQDFGPRNEGAETAAIGAHEGEHGVDQRANGMPRSRAQEFRGEFNAFRTQSFVNQGLGFDSRYGIWTNESGFNGGRMEFYAGKSTELWCQDNNLCQ